MASYTEEPRGRGKQGQGRGRGRGLRGAPRGRYRGRGHGYAPSRRKPEDGSPAAPEGEEQLQKVEVEGEEVGRVSLTQSSTPSTQTKDHPHDSSNIKNVVATRTPMYISEGISNGHSIAHLSIDDSERRKDNVSSRTRGVLIVEEGWQYRDPEGAEHGPFLAAKLVKWIDQGYFSGGLQVRKVARNGAGAWTPLKYVEADVRREAALTVVPLASGKEEPADSDEQGVLPAVSPHRHITPPPPPPPPT